MSEEEFKKELKKSRESKENIEDMIDGRKKAKSMIDKAQHTILLVTDSHHIGITGNSVDIQLSLATLFSELLSDNVLTVDDMKNLVDIADKANKHPEISEELKDIKELTRTLSQLVNLMEREK